MVKNYSLVWEFVVSTVAHPGVCLIHNSSDVRWRHGIRRRPHAGDIKRCASCLNYSCQIMIDENSVFLHINTGVILIGDVNTTDHCLIPAEMKGCQVSKCVKLGY